MINFPRSTFTWQIHPWVPDPYYKWAGGFVGQPGQVYHVRFHLDARCLLRDAQGQTVAEFFLGAPCHTEYTIARTNLFQLPSAEWRLAFSHTDSLPIASRPSAEREEVRATPLSRGFQDWRLNLRSFAGERVLSAVAPIVQATFAGEALNARTAYRDAGTGLGVELEYPVNVMNLNAADGEFQVCTGPVLLPDLATWDGGSVHRVFIAHAAFSRFDRVEFILRREVAAAPEERVWLDQPRGRDRLELADPEQRPPGYPPPRPRPTVFNETWDLEARNAVIEAVEG